MFGRGGSEGRAAVSAADDSLGVVDGRSGRLVAETGVGDVKALKGVAGMRLRAGDWRVLFTIKANTITIHAVGHRRDIYD